MLTAWELIADSYHAIAPCTLRVPPLRLRAPAEHVFVVGKNYRLQDIQLSKSVRRSCRSPARGRLPVEAALAAASLQLLGTGRERLRFNQPLPILPARDPEDQAGPFKPACLRLPC